MDFDLAEVLSAAVEGRLEPTTMLWKSGASICVVMASGGYPGNFEPGKIISGLPEACNHPEIAVFHSGTRNEAGFYYTCSGRVLGVTAAATNLEDARLSAYKAVQSIHFDGAHFRSDIGAGLRAAPMTAERA
jgi:phosphoribosylamine--glycine ligase